MDVREIRCDFVAVPHVHAGPDVGGNVRGDVNRNIARACLQIGVAALAPGVHQFYGDSAGTGFSAG